MYHFPHSSYLHSQSHSYIFSPLFGTLCLSPFFCLLKQRPYHITSERQKCEDIPFPFPTGQNRGPLLHLITPFMNTSEWQHQKHKNWNPQSALPALPQPTFQIRDRSATAENILLNCICHILGPTSSTLIGRCGWAEHCKTSTGTLPHFPTHEKIGRACTNRTNTGAADPVLYPSSNPFLSGFLKPSLELQQKKSAQISYRVVLGYSSEPYRKAKPNRSIALNRLGSERSAARRGSGPDRAKVPSSEHAENAVGGMNRMNPPLALCTSSDDGMHGGTLQLRNFMPARYVGNTMC